MAVDKQRNAEKAMSSIVEQAVSRVAVQRLNGFEDHIDTKVSAQNTFLADACGQYDDEVAKNMRGQTLISIALSITVIVGGAYLVSSEGIFGDKMTYSEFIAYYLGSTSLHALMTDLTSSLNQFNKSKISLSTVLAYMNEPTHNSGSSKSITTTPMIEMQNLSFSRKNAQTGIPFQVLHNISFQIAAGAKCGLVGPSGSGKTTMLKLITQLYAPQDGRILINGCLIDEVRTVEMFAVLEQECLLYEGSVKYNICIGEDCNEAKLTAALHMAIFQADVDKMALGVNSQVGINGKLLSGGMRQRLALARAIYRVAMGRRVLLLDEPTSAQDPKTMSSIRDGLNMMADITIFAITHTISFLEKFNHILVLDHGHLIEGGPKDELMEQQGHWYRLYRESAGVAMDDSGNITIKPSRLLKMWLFAAPEITSQMLEPFTQFFMPRSCEEGEVLFSQGKPADAMYIVVSGTLEEVHSSKAGSKPKHVREWKSGDVHGLDNLVHEGGVCENTCLVTLPSTVMTLPRLLYRFAIKESPELEHLINTMQNAVSLLRAPPFLCRIPLFSLLSQAQLQVIAKLLHIQVFSAGTTLFDAANNDPCAALYLVASGSVAIKELVENGGADKLSNCVLAHRNTRTFFGASALSLVAERLVSDSESKSSGGADDQTSREGNYIVGADSSSVPDCGNQPRAIHARCSKRSVILTINGSAMETLQESHMEVLRSVARVADGIRQASSIRQLRTHWLFSTLPEALLVSLATKMQPKTFVKGEMLVEAEHNDDCYLVVDGAVMCVHSYHNKDRSVGVTQGHAVNMEALEVEVLRSCGVFAEVPVKPTQAYIVSQENVVTLTLSGVQFCSTLVNYDSGKKGGVLTELQRLVALRGSFRTEQGLKQLPGLEALDPEARLSIAAQSKETVLVRGATLTKASIPIQRQIQRTVGKAE
ncbi:hypothetical protein CYMTET_12621 [Cymbomonas tetramitiformis]|uniref:Uncharacterized protein n=1 Tax=Cymbomonas tetramitiformis TaxID=36881 RepID=A0AAE0LC97_9CHLO|nr:hypothetical protein CYMTET_12621 [Cymbomonas tetramitiformis]